MLALLAYFALALLVTYPAAALFTSAVPGDLIADRDQNLWNLWWVRQALSLPTNPYHTGMLYYPYGVDLYYHTLGLPQGLLSLLPQALWGLPAAYNTVLLLAFTLSGYGAFRLALMRVGRPLPAFLGGLVFAFTPYTLDALKGQLEVLSLQWMPFYAEAWLRAAAPRQSVGQGEDQPQGKPGRTRAGRIAAGASAGLFLALAALSSLYYALYLVLFTGAHVLYLTLRGWLSARAHGSARRSAREQTLTREPAATGNSSRPLEPVIIAACVGVFALIILWPYAVGLAANRGNPLFEVRADPAHRLAHSADLLSFFAPPHDHPLLGTTSARPGVDEPPIHDYLSLGYAALAISLAGAFAYRKRGDTLFWALLAVGALILSMGPQLQIGRHLTGIPLPFRLVEGLPGLDAIAKPERLVVLSRLCMGVLAALGGAWLLSVGSGRTGRGAARSRQAALFGAALGLLLLELPIHPRYWEPLHVPGALRLIAAPPRQASKAPELEGLMELPFATQQAQTVGERMLAQTVHGRPIMAGYLSRNYNSPIIGSCSPFWGFISPLDVPTEGHEIASPLVVSRPLDVLNFYKIGYIVVYRGAVSEKERAAYLETVSEVSGGPPITTSGEVSLYRVDPEPSPQSGVLSFHIGAGWYSPEDAGGEPFRWLKGSEGSICVFAPHEMEASLVMEGTAFGKEQPINVSLPWGSNTGDPSGPLAAARLPANGQFQRLITRPVRWKPGVTEVRVLALEPGITPRSVDPNAQDDRPLTVGIRGVRLESKP